MWVLNVDSVSPKLQLVMEGDSAKIVLKHLGHTCISRDLVQLLMPFATGYMVAWNARPTTEDEFELEFNGEVARNNGPSNFSVELRL